MRRADTRSGGYMLELIWELYQHDRMGRQDDRIET
jgi:hypothetical protein